MASTWGTSWGTSWATSWNRTIAPPTPTPVVVGGAGPAKKRRRILVKIDDDYFEVASEQDAVALLTMARQTAAEAAPKVAAAAVAKSAKTKKPAAKVKALEVQPPTLKVVDPGFTDAFMHQLRAQVDATQAAIARIYDDALRTEQARVLEARRVMDEQDAADFSQIMAMDADEDEKLVRDFLKTLKRSKRGRS